MIILPAIDLMNGQVVRLVQGRADQKTVYSDDPVAMAQRWEAEGGDYLHLVDLDAAFTGEQRNLEWVKKIVEGVSIPVELGGGMRTPEAVAAAFDAGVSRVVIGTRAIEHMAFIEEMVARFTSERIAVGLDAKNGQVALRGWTETVPLSPVEVARRAEQAGAGTIIYTDIATDGMLTGPNFAGVEQMLNATRCQLIASGGISSVDDVKRLDLLPNLYGTIIGKALYENSVSLGALKSRTQML